MLTDVHVTLLNNWNGQVTTFTMSIFLKCYIYKRGETQHAANSCYGIHCCVCGKLTTRALSVCMCLSFDCNDSEWRAIVTGTLTNALHYVEHQTCIRFTSTTDFTVSYLSFSLGSRWVCSLLCYLFH